MTTTFHDSCAMIPQVSGFSATTEQAKQVSSKLWNQGYTDESATIDALVAERDAEMRGMGEDLIAIQNMHNEQKAKLYLALAERDAEIERLKSIAYSDDGAGGEGMKLFLQVRAQRKVLEQAKEALENHAGNYKLNNAQCDHQNAAITAIQGVLK